MSFHQLFEIAFTEVCSIRYGFEHPGFKTPSQIKISYMEGWCKEASVIIDRDQRLYEKERIIGNLLHFIKHMDPVQQVLPFDAIESTVYSMIAASIVLQTFFSETIKKTYNISNHVDNFECLNILNAVLKSFVNIGDSAAQVLVRYPVTFLNVVLDHDKDFDEYCDEHIEEIHEHTKNSEKLTSLLGRIETEIKKCISLHNVKPTS